MSENVTETPWPTAITPQQVTEIQTLATVEKDARLYAALARAQGKFPPIPRNRTVTVFSKKTNSKYTFDYAPLETIFDCVRAPLAAEGLALIQPLIQEDGKTYLETLLLHEAGGRLSSKIDVPRGGTMQEFGSALTYLRRYSVVSILGIATEEDDDANTADGNTVTEKKDSETGRPSPKSAGEAGSPQVQSGGQPQPPVPSPADLTARAERFVDSTEPKDIAAMVENIEDVNQLQALMSAETTRKMRGKHARKTVSVAIDKRLRQLGAGGDAGVTPSEPAPSPSPPQGLSEGEPTAPDAAEDALRTPPAAQESPAAPASPSENGTITAEKVRAAIAFIQDQPSAAEGNWSVTSVLLGLTKHGVEESRLEAVSEDKLRVVWENLPDNVTSMIEILGPEALAKLAAAAK